MSMHSDKPPSNAASAPPRPAVSPRRGRQAKPQRLAGDGSRPRVSAGPFAARYSDGRTAVAHAAQVRIDERGLAIALADDGRAPARRTDQIVWPLDGLRTAQPLHSGSTDVLVSRQGDEAATLYVADAGFAESLALAAPNLTARSQRWRHARPWLIVSAGIAAAVAVLAALEISPARAVARLLPESARQHMGDDTIRSLTKTRRLCTAAGGQAAVQRLSARLTRSLPAGTPHYSVIVVDWGLVNAFAVPGGRIVLTRGLITKAASADEVAGVLAHEMGHAIELDPEAALVRGLGMTAVADLLFGSGTMTSVGVLLAELSYSRDAERRADMHGLALLKAAGIAPQGLADFFRRVMKTDEGGGASKTTGGALDVLSTHPATAERIRMIERQAPYPATAALDVQDWQALREMCAAPAAPGSVPPGAAKPAPARPKPPVPLPPSGRPPVARPPTPGAPPKPSTSPPTAERPVDL